MQLHLDEGIHTRVWEASASSPSRGALLLLHGVESHAEWFDQAASRLAEKGFHVYAYDRPGWGQSEGGRGHLQCYSEEVARIDRLATQLREEHGTLHLAGMSWGGLLALYVALRRAVLFDSVCLIAPGIFPQAGLSLWQRCRAVAGTLCGYALHVPLSLEVAAFTQDPTWQAVIQKDPHRVTSVTAAFCLETFKMRRFVGEHIALRRLPPTTLLLAEHDTIIDNAKTRRLLESVTPTPSIITVESARHSLVFDAPVRVADAIEALAQRADALARREEWDIRATVRIPEASAKEAAADGSRHSPKHVVVMGAGAVGSLVGGCLAWGGHNVTLVGREAHVAAINTNGLRLRIGDGERVVRSRLQAVTSPAQITDMADLLILCVKSFDTAEALAAVAPLMLRQTVLLSLQNGVQNEANIAKAFPAATVLAGAICAYVDCPTPGCVHQHTDRGGLAGAMLQGDAARAKNVWESILPFSGMEARFCDGPDAATRVKWSKLMLNLAFNALNGLTGKSVGEILADPEHGLLAVRALQEGFRVMRARRIVPVDLPGYSVRNLSQVCRLPAFLARYLLAKATANDAGGRSSLAQDLARGRSVTEIDEINGHIVREGAVAGIATPANAELCRLITERVT